jgi:SNF2 family DNA or RNA helicase
LRHLASFKFSVAVFDEIQNLKNTQTQIYQAAHKIQARMKLGLTGTPIENRLEELKALLDLTLPGYLGRDADFENRYVKPIENREDEGRRCSFPILLHPLPSVAKKRASFMIFRKNRRHSNLHPFGGPGETYTATRFPPRERNSSKIYKKKRPSPISTFLRCSIC